MAPTLPEKVDARRLAAQGARLTGDLPAAALSRVTAILTEVQPVAVVIDFSFNDEGRVALRGHLQASAVATCQRCLEPVILNLRGDFEHLPEQEEEAAETALGSGRLERESPLDLLALIEDEILLACPMVPMHPDDQCQPLITGGIASRENPFDVLAALPQNKPEEPRKFDAASNSEE